MRNSGYIMINKKKDDLHIECVSDAVARTTKVTSDPGNTRFI